MQPAASRTAHSPHRCTKLGRSVMVALLVAVLERGRVACPESQTQCCALTELVSAAQCCRCCATRCEAHTADSVGVDAVRGAGAPHVCTVHAGHRSASSRHRAEGSSSSGAGQPTPMTCDACRHAAQAAVCCTAGRADTHAYAILATLVAAARLLDHGRKAGLCDFEVMSPGLICA